MRESAEFLKIGWMLRHTFRPFAKSRNVIIGTQLRTRARVRKALRKLLCAARERTFRWACGEQPKAKAMHQKIMKRLKSLIDSHYEALLFAKSAPEAREAAGELVRIVLGEDALARPLEDAVRDCCRVLRPAKDPREQLRFEEEFLDLAIWPGASRKMAA
jgi:hypothetical protein